MTRSKEIPQSKPGEVVTVHSQDFEDVRSRAQRLVGKVSTGVLLPFLPPGTIRQMFYVVCRDPTWRLSSRNSRWQRLCGLRRDQSAAGRRSVDLRSHRGDLEVPASWYYSAGLTDMDNRVDFERPMYRLRAASRVNCRRHSGDSDSTGAGNPGFPPAVLVEADWSRLSSFGVFRESLCCPAPLTGTAQTR